MNREKLSYLLPAALAIFAFRDLLQLNPSASISEEVEEWFFLPSDTAPAAVVAMSLWLLFRRREGLRSLDAHGGPVWLTASLLLAGAAVLVWATLTQASGLLAPALALTGLGFGCLYGGPAAIRMLLLPAGFLLLAVPIPPPLINEVVFSLQLWTAQYAGWMLFFLGIPSLVVGDVISQSDETFRVIETCSGFRSALTLTMLSILVGDLFRRRGLHALLLVISAPVIGFAVNGLRVLALILNPYSEVATVHAAQGVAILLVGLALLYAWDGLLARLLPESGSAAGPSGVPSSRRPASPPSSVPIVGIATPLLAALAAITLWLPPWEPDLPPFQVGLLRGFHDAEGWSSSGRDLDRIFLGSVGFDRFVHRRFEADGQSVDLMVALDDHPDRRFRSVFSPKIGLPGGGWTIVSRARVQLGSDGPAATARVLRSGSNIRLSYQWYQGSQGLGNEVVRSLLALDAGPFPREIEPAAVRLSTRLDGLEPEALAAGRDRLSRFLDLIRPELALLEERLTHPPAS